MALLWVCWGFPVSSFPLNEIRLNVKNICPNWFPPLEATLRRVRPFFLWFIRAWSAVTVMGLPQSTFSVFRRSSETRGPPSSKFVGRNWANLIGWGLFEGNVLRDAWPSQSTHGSNVSCDSCIHKVQQDPSMLSSWLATWKEAKDWISAQLVDIQMF